MSKEVKSISQLIEECIPFYKLKGEPETVHKIVYDSSSETLEPLYFFLIDLMNDQNYTPEKLIDNFTSSPGSGHFSELQGKASVMQQQAASTMEKINAIVRSVLNLLYDLRDFKTRLQYYDDLKNKDKKQAATLTLKQIWLDKVDMTKGNSSIKAMALGQAGFVTLLDAFLVAEDEKKAEKLDLNERVKRILIQRIQEFNIWLKQSEKELRKRFEIEKTYLKSQVSSLKLYTRWAKPYLRAAQKLEMSNNPTDPALVNAFNTIVLELCLFAKDKVRLPDHVSDLKTRRDYYSCVLIEFYFRGIPQRVGQHYTFGGRTEITFKGYALNEDEIEYFKRELEKSDVDDALGLIEGMTTESLEQLQDEIDYWTNEDSDKEENKKTDESNPFLALIGHYEKNEKDNKKEKNTIKELTKDNWVEKEFLRQEARKKAKDKAFFFFHIYKLVHGMASFRT